MCRSDKNVPPRCSRLVPGEGFNWKESPANLGGTSSPAWLLVLGLLQCVALSPNKVFHPGRDRLHTWEGNQTRGWMPTGIHLCQLGSLANWRGGGHRAHGRNTEALWESQGRELLLVGLEDAYFLPKIKIFGGIFFLVSYASDCYGDWMFVFFGLKVGCLSQGKVGFAEKMSKFHIELFKIFVTPKWNSNGASS